MGRKERRHERNKLVTEHRKAIKQEVKLKQNDEELRPEAGDALLVRQHGGEPRRGEAGRERRRMEKDARVKLLSVAAELEPVALNLVGLGPIGKKDSATNFLNPNNVPEKPSWKFENWKEKEIPILSTNGVVVEDLKLEDFFRPEEIRTLVELLHDSMFTGSTLAGIQLIDISVGFAAVALNRFDLIKRLTKDDQFYSYTKLASPVTCAILTQNWDIIHYLLQKDDRAHNLDRFGNTPLLQAAMADDWTELAMIALWKIFQVQLMTDIAFGNEVGMTLMHVLAWRGWDEVMDDILPLNPSCPEEQRNLIELINAPTNNGITPLMMALQQGCVSSAQLLISRGARVTDEDKDGYTALCYAIDHMCETALSNEPGFEILNSISTACGVVITALNDPECSMDAKAYVAKRFDLIRKPADIGQNQLNNFYRVGRSVFGFIVRFLEGGINILMEMKLFSSILSCGRRFIKHDEFVSMLCAITFDILTYAENIRPSYAKVCEAFVNDGGAHFCRLAMDRSVKRYKEFDTSKNFKPSRSTVSEYQKACFGVTAPKPIPTIETNFGVAALLSFIQLIDCPHVDSWFQVHFSLIKRSYDAFHEVAMPITALFCDLDVEIEDRLKRKVYIFDLLYHKYGIWTSLRTIVTDHLKSQGIPYEESELNKKSLKRRARKERLLVAKTKE